MLGGLQCEEQEGEKKSLKGNRERGKHILYISRVSGAENFFESCIIADTNVPKLHMGRTSVAEGLEKPRAESGGRCVILVPWL